MSFFDTKLMVDLLQRMEDHTRIQSFLTNQILSVIFTFLSFFPLKKKRFLYSASVESRRLYIELYSV